jgi:hypothetical protein
VLDSENATSRGTAAYRYNRYCHIKLGRVTGKQRCTKRAHACSYILFYYLVVLNVIQTPQSDAKNLASVDGGPYVHVHCVAAKCRQEFDHQKKSTSRNVLQRCPTLNVGYVIQYVAPREKEAGTLNKCKRVLDTATEKC